MESRQTQYYDSRPMMGRRAPAARPRDTLSGNAIEAGHTPGNNAPACYHLPWEPLWALATVLPALYTKCPFRVASHVAGRVPQQTTTYQPAISIPQPIPSRRLKLENKKTWGKSG